MSPYRRNIMVGATVLVAAMLFGWLVLRFSSKSARIFAPPQMPVTFTGSRADGLSQGSPVLFLGVSVGRVTNVILNSQGEGVIIDTSINRSPPIPGNVEATIVQSSAIGGGSSLSLELNNNPPEGTLAEGSTLNATYVGLQLNFLPPGFSRTADQFGKMSEEIRKTAQQLRESGAIADLDDALKKISVQAAKVGPILDSMQSVVGNEENRKNIELALGNIRKTTEATTRISSKLDALADSVQKNSEQLTRQTTDRLTQLSAVLANLQTLTEKLNTGKGSAGLLVNDPRLYEAMVDSTKQLDATVSDLHRLVEQWEEEGVSFKLK